MKPRSACEGIVLKDPAPLYRPGERATAWLKLKPKLTLDVIVAGGSGHGLQWAIGANASS